MAFQWRLWCILIETLDRYVYRGFNIYSIPSEHDWIIELLFPWKPTQCLLQIWIFLGVPKREMSYRYLVLWSYWFLIYLYTHPPTKKVLNHHRSLSGFVSVDYLLCLHYFMATPQKPPPPPSSTPAHNPTRQWIRRHTPRPPPPLVACLLTPRILK